MQKFQYFLTLILLILAFVAGPKSVDAQILECNCVIDPLAPANDLEIVSRNSADVQTQNHSEAASISADGNWVAFLSTSSFFAEAPVGSSLEQVFLKNLSTGQLTLVTTGIDGLPGNQQSYAPIISDDGSKVAFLSFADNLTNDAYSTTHRKHVFVYDVATGTNELITKLPDGTVADHHAFASYSFSPDGHKLAFETYENNLFSAVTQNDSLERGILIKDFLTGALQLVEPATVDGIADHEARIMSEPAFSQSGTKLTYKYKSPTVSGEQIVVHDLIMDTAQVVSTLDNGSYTDGTKNGPMFAANDNLVMFESELENLLPDERDGDENDVFVKNLVTGELEHISVTNDGQGRLDHTTRGASISSDGNLVAYATASRNVETTSNFTDIQIFVYNRITRQAQIIARGYDNQLVRGNSEISRFAFANDDTIAFVSASDEFVEDDANGPLRDVFIRKLSGECVF